MTRIIHPESTSQPDPYFWKTSVNPHKLALLDRWALGNNAADIGCGSGAYAHHLMKMGFEVTAVDAENRLGSNEHVRFISATVPPLPLADASCDTLVMFDILEHVVEEDSLLAEARRVCRGRLIVSVPSDNDGDLVRYGVCLLHNLDKTHKRAYSPVSLRLALEKSGFRILHLEPHVPASAPYIVGMFFCPSLICRALRAATIGWVRVLSKLGIIRVDLAGDWFAVAEPKGN